MSQVSTSRRIVQTSSSGVGLGMLVRKLKLDGVKFAGCAMEYGVEKLVLGAKTPVSRDGKRTRFILLPGREISPDKRTIAGLFEEGRRRGYRNPTVYSTLLFFYLNPPKALGVRQIVALNIPIFSGSGRFQSQEVLYIKRGSGGDWISSLQVGAQYRLSPSALYLFQLGS